MLDTGNVNWMENLFDSYYDKVYGFLYVRLNNTSLAEDLSSQTFLKAVEKLHTYNGEKGAVSTWIFTIALNEMRSYFRSQKKISLANLEEIPELQADNNIELAVIDKEDRKNLITLIGNLHEREQNIIMLKYFGSMSNREIAAVLSLSESNVGTILNRVIKKLRNMCDQMEIPAYKGIGGINYER